MSDFIATLQCPKCGGKLTHITDTERYRCDYCGNEHVVRERYDKATSKTAMQQLSAEVAEAEAEVQKYVEAWEEAKGAIEINERTLRKAEGHIAHLRQQLATARGFHGTRRFGLIFGVPLGLELVAILMLAWRWPLLSVEFKQMVLPVLTFGALFFLSPILYAWFTEFQRVHNLPLTLRKAEADLDRHRPMLQARINAARAAADQYPADKVEALRAEIAEKKRRLAAHYLVSSEE